VSIYRSAAGTWGVDFRDEWNRRVRKPVGTEAAARAVEAKLREQADMNRAALRRMQAAPQLSADDALDAYLAHVRANPRTKEHMKDRLGRALRAIGQQQLEQITPRLVETWREEKAKALSPHTLWRDAKMLRSFGAWLTAESYVLTSPFAQLYPEKPHETSARAISYEEESRIVQAFEVRTLLRVLLALDAGLATQEITDLRKNHVDLTAGVLTSWRTKVKSARTIPLTRRLAAALGEALKNLAPDSLVNSRGGQKLRPHGTTAFLHKARSRLGPHFRFHDLRHTFATRIAAVSTPFVTARLLGHSIPRWSYGKDGLPMLITTREYVHPPLEELRAAIAAMEQRNPNCPQPERKQP
jgi:integrase